MHASSAGAIELTKIDSLPRSQNQIAFADDQGLRSPQQTRFDMGIGIAFGMAVLGQVGRCKVGNSSADHAQHWDRRSH